MLHCYSVKNKKLIILKILVEHFSKYFSMRISLDANPDLSANTPVNIYVHHLNEAIQQMEYVSLDGNLPLDEINERYWSEATGPLELFYSWKKDG